MGVKVREKASGSGVWWVFIWHQGRRTCRKVGSKKAADKVAEQIQAKLTLGQDALPRKKDPVQTLETYYQGFLDTYLVTALRESTRISYEGSFRKHILPKLVVPVKQTVTYRASFGHVELFQEYRKPLRSK